MYMPQSLQKLIQFGGEHKQTKESAQCLYELTEKAVTMQKTVSGVSSV